MSLNAFQCSKFATTVLVVSQRIVQGLVNKPGRTLLISSCREHCRWSVESHAAGQANTGLRQYHHDKKKPLIFVLTDSTSNLLSTTRNSTTAAAACSWTSKRLYHNTSIYGPMTRLSGSSGHLVELCPHMKSWKRFKGHAKWQNIKSTKEANDRARAKLFQKYTFMIRRAILEGGNPNPKLNGKLAAVIEQARKNNMPSSTIEAAIKRTMEQSSKIQSATIELMGPNQSFFVVEVETSNMNRTRYDIKQTCKKYGCIAFSEEGRTRHLFDKKGIIRASMYKSGEKLDKDNVLDIGIEVGAEEVLENEDLDGNVVFDFVCSPDDFNSVKKAMETMTIDVNEAAIEYLPRECVELSDSDRKMVAEICSSLEELDDVVRIFDNVQM